MTIELAGIAVAVVALVLAPALHYAASGIALQAAAGVPLPRQERYLSQLAAAAANRLTPGGVGAAALNVRYLTRRGSTGARALAAVGVLQVLGAFADLTVFAALFAVASAFGLTPHGAGPRLLGEVELPALVVSRHPWLMAGLASAATLLVVCRRRTTRRPQREDRLSSLLGELRSLRHRRRDVAVVMAASASTTIVLGLGFVAAVATVAGPQVWRQCFSLLIGYMVGSALGNAAPVPSGIGTTDTALIGVVAASGLVMHQAVIAVVLFRLVAFWLPAALGLAAGAALRRRGAY
ncbi:MAG TPA: lysylphosphatidylglycerol synthase domain-containing protein [Mycobacteriales bacterium]|nr:lysylphosphatidylglycerol synthase domain-containing protein [Mycobacteriales bacterium]